MGFLLRVRGLGSGCAPSPENIGTSSRKCWDFFTWNRSFWCEFSCILTEMLSNLLLGEQLDVYMYCWWLRGVRSNQSNPPRYGPVYCELTHDNSGGALVPYKQNPLNSRTRNNSYQTTRHNINITSWNKQQCNVLTPHCKTTTSE